MERASILSTAKAVRSRIFFAGGLFQGLLYGFMDHWYLLRLKIKGLRTILFYRDLYWTFSSVMRHTPLIKRILFYCFYWVDLFFYRFYLSKIVFPSSNMHRWFPWKVFSFGVLSPGLREPQEHRTQLPEKRPLTLFYVGGMGSSYRLDKIFQVIENTPGVEATFCVRKEEWAKEQGKYQSAVRSGRIQIIHKEKNELGPYLAQADIGVLFLEPSDVRLFMLPLKVFEYIEYGLPVLSSAGTIAGDFIIQEGLGWALPYQESAIEDWFQKAVSNIFEIRSQRRAILMKAQNHTWRHRVQELIAMIKGPKQ
jgi:glycosyltransferase involved in cell wall biosynthesis